MLESEPAVRPGITKILENPFLKIDPVRSKKPYKTFLVFNND